MKNPLLYALAGINASLLVLVALQFMTKQIPYGVGFSASLYEMLISRSWAATAAITFFLTGTNLKNPSLNKHVTVILLVYSAAVTLAAAALVTYYVIFSKQ